MRLQRHSASKIHEHTLVMSSCVLEQDTIRHHSPGVLISNSECRKAGIYNTFPHTHGHEPWGREQGAHPLQFNLLRLYAKWCFANRLTKVYKQTRCGDLVMTESCWPDRAAARKAWLFLHSPTKFGNPDPLHVSDSLNFTRSRHSFYSTTDELR